MKRGWLIINGFLRSTKFDDLYALLANSAEKFGVELQLKNGAESVVIFGDESRENRLKTPDFVLFWDKDEVFARVLERRNIPVFNGAKAIEICDNKILTAEALYTAGVQTPKTLLAPKTFEGVGYTDFTFLDQAKKTLGFPMIIKEAYGSFGAQVYLANTRKEAEQIIRKIGWKPFIMQEFIQESRGKDIRVNVVGDKVICAILRENPQDFRSNITNGGTAKTVTLTKEQETLALRACRAVNADFAGVDILLGKDGPLVCEINTSPHFRSTLDCTGIDLSEYILRYILERI